MFTHTTVAQNAAHRADLTWIKIGKSEYMRSDGVTIKRNCMTARWEIFAADGNRAMDATYGKFPLSEHSLTWAKITAEEVAA